MSQCGSEASGPTAPAAPAGRAGRDVRAAGDEPATALPLPAGSETAHPVGPASRWSSALRVAGGFVRLSKIKVFQHYFGLALAWLLLRPDVLHRPGSTTAMVLFLIGSIAIVACACSADDITGYRNGSDAMNYRAEESLRDIRTKPLLSGAVTERQAIAFSVAAGVVALLAGAAAFRELDWRSPVAAYVLYVAGFAFSVQYSTGLRISFHRGGSEALLCLSTAAGLLAPFLAVNGEWTRPAVLEALLLGLWLVMVSSCSNVNDAKGDGAVGRRTLAVSARDRVVKGALVVYFLLSVGLLLALTFSTPHWPLWTLVTVLPAVATHAAQLHSGIVRNRWLEARRQGLIAYNLGFLGLALPTYYAFR